MIVSFFSLTLAEYHEQEEIFKLRLGHLKKVCFFNHDETHKNLYYQNDDIGCWELSD